MPKEQRAELHERFADWLTEAARDRMAEYEGDPRPSPRAGVSIPRRARYGRRPGACTGRPGGRAPARVRVPRGRAGAGVGPATRPLPPGRPRRGRVHTLVALAELLPELGEFREAHDTAVQAVEAADAAGDAAFRIRAELVRTSRARRSIRRRRWRRRVTKRSACSPKPSGSATPTSGPSRLALTQELFFLGQTAAAIRLLEHLPTARGGCGDAIVPNRRSARRQLVLRSDPGPGGLRHARPRRGAPR